jgi:dTDP-D-glucose 4,6-dehydratase
MPFDRERIGMSKSILIAGEADFIDNNSARRIYNKRLDRKILIQDALTCAVSIDDLPVGGASPLINFACIHTQRRSKWQISTAKPISSRNRVNCYFYSLVGSQ